MPPISRAALLILVILCCPSMASATLYNVRGAQYGDYTATLSLCVSSTTTTYDQIRIPCPSTSPPYDFGSSANTWLLKAIPLVRVVNAQGVDIPHTQTPYNEGFLTSGYWIRIYNPHPGTLHQYYIKYTASAFASVNAYGVSADFPDPLPESQANYTASTETIDLSSVVDQHRSEAIQNPVWQAGLPVGVRGALARLALHVNKFSYMTGAWNISKWEVTASDVLTDRRGDCDDLVKAQCALLRSIGVPSRIALTVQMPGTRDLGPIYSTASANLHAIGQYWNGLEWESFVPHLALNFATADQIVLGVAKDFWDLYPVSDRRTFSDEPNLSLAIEGVQQTGTGDSFVTESSVPFAGADILSQAVYTRPQSGPWIVPAGQGAGVWVGGSPVSASLTGPAELACDVPGTWTATASGGNGNYSYVWWWWQPSGSGGGSIVKPIGYGSTYAGNSGFSADCVIGCDVTSSGITSKPQMLVHVTCVGGGDPGGGGDDPEPCQHPCWSREQVPNGAGGVSRGVVALRYSMPVAAEVDIRVHDLQGRNVAVLQRGRVDAGWHSLNWSTVDLHPGLYFVSLLSNGRRDVIRIATGN